MEPYLVYKPTKSGSGAAVRVNLRVTAEEPAAEVGGYGRVRGGVFVDLAAQAGFGEGGFAAFGWKDPGLLTVKWGLPDVLKVLTAIREVRVGGREVPGSMRGKDGDPFTVSMFHRFGEGGTAITFRLEAERSLLRVSKAKDWARSIAFEMYEERGLEAYLELALAELLRAGIR